jgi:hypothetical protein
LQLFIHYSNGVVKLKTLLLAVLATRILWRVDPEVDGEVFPTAPTRHACSKIPIPKSSEEEEGGQWNSESSYKVGCTVLR